MGKDEDVQFENVFRWAMWVVCRQLAFEILPLLVIFAGVYCEWAPLWLMCIVGWLLSGIFPVLAEFLLAKNVEEG